MSKLPSTYWRRFSPMTLLTLEMETPALLPARHRGVRANILTTSVQLTLRHSEI